MIELRVILSKALWRSDISHSFSLFLCERFASCLLCATDGVSLWNGLGSEVRQRDVKMEPPNSFFGSQFGHAPNGSKTGLVSIAITLNPAAAEVSQGHGPKGKVLRFK